ncbi:MAG: hypothetical protein ABSF54_26170 [Bryobacteraceae bacterium]|jgi:hypothetical protein
MTLATVSHSAWRSVAFAAIVLIPLSAYPQTTLTGAIQFSTNSSGAFSGADYWNTLGGDSAWDLWLALNADATLPVNGPSDAQAAISIPLLAGNSYKYYIFASPNGTFSFDGLNLFFDGNDSTPGISVFGALNGSRFLPNSSSTLTLQFTTVAGSGKGFYSSGGVIAVLTGYDLNTPATPPGDVCRPFGFSPGGALSLFGSFALQVFPAASLSLSQASGAPGTALTLIGSGFASNETVEIYAGQLSMHPIHATMTDASGDFTLTLREPQLPYGPIDFYVEGLTSGELGAAALSVTPALAANPGTVAPGATTNAYVFGFGSGETVDIYWNNPRELLGTANANGEGSGTLTITIPANASPGINGVIGVGQTTKAIGIGKVNVQ